VVEECAGGCGMLGPSITDLVASKIAFGIKMSCELADKINAMPGENLTIVAPAIPLSIASGS
jgi:hypothetical protein